MQYITLVSAEERIPHICGPKDDPDHTTIYFQRVPSQEHQRIISKHLNLVSGVVDMTAVRCDLCQYAINGWANMRDWTGKEIPFHKDLIAYLPVETRDEIASKVLAETVESFLFA
jgi:hypothetical protein